MKHLLYIIVLLLFYSCSCKKNTSNLSEDKTYSIIDTNCPPDGKCSLEILKNKSLNVLSDEFGSTYYETNNSEKSSVIIYRYKKNIKENIQDSNYTEEILFETENSKNNISLQDLDLQKTKMIFGRLCFCRGKTGYYKVENGILNFEQKKGSIKFNLSFTIKQVPQILKTITVDN